MNLNEFFIPLKNHSSFEVLLTTGVEPKIRKSKSWVALQSQKLSAADCREVCLSLLTQEQKHHLQDFGFVTGRVDVEKNLNIKFDVQINQQGFTAFLKKMNPDLQDPIQMGLPALLVETVLRAQPGIVWITGESHQGKSTTAYSLLENVNREKSFHVSSLESSTGRIFQPNQSTFSQNEVALEEAAKCDVQLFRHSQIVMLDVGFNKHICDLILGLIQSGQQVILVTTHQSLELAMESFVQYYPNEQKNYVLKILSRYFLCGLSQKLIPSQTDGQTLAFEFIVGTQKIQTLLKDLNFLEMNDEVRRSGEKTGMRTMNQALLQLIMRRKIELKVAFENTLDPDELDQLLKKVGI